jgi:hypothetical protein
MRTKKIKSDPVISSDNTNTTKPVELTFYVDSAPALENDIQVDTADAKNSTSSEIISTVMTVEKKKRGRKKLVKPDAESLTSSDDYKHINEVIDTKTVSNDITNGSIDKKPRKVRVSKKKYDQQQEQSSQPGISNNVTSDENIQEEILQLTSSNVVIHKKRGRKPRGGKIIHENQFQKNNNPEVPNIILHLKCVLSDLKKSNDVDSHKLDEHCNEKKMEILCYNDSSDQNNSFSSNVSNMTKFDNDGDVRKMQCKHVMTLKEEEKKKHNLTSPLSNSINTHQKYDPSTFSSKNIHPTPIPITNDTSVNINAHSFSFSEKEDMNGDYISECKNSRNKEIWKKILQLKLNFHKNDALCVQRSACFWDTCEFDTPPIYIPMSTSKGYGCFCHPECAVAFLMKENIDTSVKFERYYLLNSIYGPIYNYNKSIKPAANPHYLLNKFYGNLTITEYRKLFQCEQIVYMVNKPLTNVLPELYEDNNDFFIGNKIIQNSTIEIKKKESKNAKSSIINEAFGIR